MLQINDVRLSCYKGRPCVREKAAVKKLIRNEEIYRLLTCSSLESGRLLKMIEGHRIFDDAKVSTYWGLLYKLFGNSDTLFGAAAFRNCLVICDLTMNHDFDRSITVGFYRW